MIDCDTPKTFATIIKLSNSLHIIDLPPNILYNLGDNRIGR